MTQEKRRASVGLCGRQPHVMPQLLELPRDPGEAPSIGWPVRRRRQDLRRHEVEARGEAIEPRRGGLRSGRCNGSRWTRTATAATRGCCAFGFAAEVVAKVCHRVLRTNSIWCQSLPAKSCKCLTHNSVFLKSKLKLLILSVSFHKPRLM